MRFDIMTLFPDLVKTVLSESIIGRAEKAGHLEINAYNIREYSEDKHRRVDDTPCGGGMGMLMSPPPIYNCYTAVTEDVKEGERVKTVYMSPRGTVLNEGVAKRIASECDRLIILCGHYEGVDQRIIDEIIDEEISIGDYVLTGGEIPACILVDCVSRLCEGVLSEAECHEVESFEDDLLEYPQYTRPIEFMGRRVPDILLSGHHANIAAWRLERAEEITRERRPDLYARYAERKAAREAEKAAKKRRRKKKTSEAEGGKNNE
ncbi:MAG: tRNA (guanosine(37)-N1)-methyltransferase TrmD [Clostridia bacterium]|nr:tRNA (guanosine(37)-N1)-methyltransferase TrmD [Clostridia bacterium]